MGVDFEIGRVTYHQALQAARLRLECRQRHDLAFDLFPLGQRVEQQALIAIDRDDYSSGRLLAQPVAMPRGHDQPALVVHREFCCAAKHARNGCRNMPILLPLFPTMAPL